MRRTAIAVAVLAAIVPAPARADDEPPTLVHAELDPLTFSNRGYGAQIGVRLPQLHGVRFAIASFSLHVPDAIAQLGGNDQWDERVRPSGAIYALDYFHAAGRDGFAAGMSVRLLRVEYHRDDVPGVAADVTEISPEAIIGYQWHPLHGGFYLQPWLALGVTVWRDHEAVIDGHTFDELPVNPFFTVNIGYEHAL